MEKMDLLSDPRYKAPVFLDWFRNAFGIARPLLCIQIEITSFCAGKCIYCPHTTAKDNWVSAHLSDQTMAALWPILRQSERAHLQGWGEPLLHPRFFNLAAFASKAGCKISTTSCGKGLDEKKAMKIIESGIDMIAFSLTGTDPESNNARQGVEFEETCNAIKLLRKLISQVGYGPQIHLAYLLLADRLEAAQKLPELMDQLDVDAAIISTLDYIALKEQKYLAFSPDETEKIAHAKAMLESIAEKARHSGRFIYYALPARQDHGISGGCREQTESSLYINVQGEVSPCVYLNVPGQRKTSFGHVMKENAWEIWKKPEYIKFRKNLGEGKIPDACLDCPKRCEEMSSF